MIFAEIIKLKLEKIKYVVMVQTVDITLIRYLTE